MKNFNDNEKYLEKEFIGIDKYLKKEIQEKNFNKKKIKKIVAFYQVLFLETNLIRYGDFFPTTLQTENSYLHLYLTRM